MASARPGALLVATLSLIAVPAQANKTEVTPLFGVTLTHTDNVSLAPEASKQSDRILQLVPGLAITSTGPRLRLSASYTPEILYYDRLEREENVFHRGNAVGTLELADDSLFVESGARIDQYDISLLGPIATNNASVTDNRTTTRSFYVTPYLLRDLGAAARLDARYRFSTVRADEKAALPDTDAGRVDLRLTNGPAFRRLTWDTAYAREVIRYEQAQETLSETVVAGGRYRVTESLGLLAQAGYERYDSGIAGIEVDGSRWSAGLEWTPTPRTRLAATTGKRLDDDAHSLEFSHRTRLTTWRAGYSEDVTTTRSEFFVPRTADTAGTLDQLFAAQYPDPAERQKAVQDFIAQAGLPASLNSPVNFFSEQFFVQKRWHASAGFVGARNSLTASLFRETREALFKDLVLPASGDFTFSDTIQTSGAGLAWSWRATPRTTFNVDTGYTRTEFLGTERMDELSYLRVGLTRQLQRRLSGSLLARRQESESTAGVNVYVENAVVAALQAKF
jgi:uncharacterized protein (PEP-CTERM system associated)